MAAGARNFTRYGRERKYDVELSGSKVHFGTAGAAVSVMDQKTGKYRPSTLCDGYDFARLADCLPNIHWFGRTVAPTEMEGGAWRDQAVRPAAISAAGIPTIMRTVRVTSSTRSMRATCPRHCASWPELDHEILTSGEY